MSEKSSKPRSSPEQITAALKRSVKALKGTRELTFTTVAERAALYVPEGRVYLFDTLKAMTPTELEDIGFGPQSRETVIVPSTRTIKSGHWCANRVIRPRFKT